MDELIDIVDEDERIPDDDPSERYRSDHSSRGEVRVRYEIEKRESRENPEK